MRSILLFACVLHFPLSSFAVLIGPGDVKDLVATDDKAVATLTERCGKVSAMLPSAKRACERALGDKRVSPAAAAYCAEHPDYGLEACLASVLGREFSPGIFAACKQTENGKGAPAKEQCLEYFAKTSSQYDSELVKLCFSHSLRRFSQAIPCLNSIRDRDVDASAVKNECKDKVSGVAFRDETFEECVERIASSAPLLRCAGSPGGLKPEVKAGTGTR